MEANSAKEISKQIKSNDIFSNIKSKYITQKVLNYLSKKKTMVIIKYNNNIKKRINVNINDYKEYCEKYSSIEIEIIPIKNEYGIFINVKEENKKYYHIYFNNNKGEIDRNYINKDDKVSKINVVVGYQIKSFKELFRDCKCIESMYFKQFYRNNINNMSRMFSNCSSLKEINLSNFNTNDVTDMSRMFNWCLSLKEINLINFNTNNVTDMCYMFSFCSSLKEINLSNFNTYNVTNIRYMFSDCTEEIKMKVRIQIKNIDEDTFE